MNKNVSALFYLIKDNQVVVCESNLKDFIELFPEEIKEIRTYNYFYRKFQNSNYFQFEFNKNYYLQKIDY